MVLENYLCFLSRSDAVNIGQAFLDAELIECIMPQQTKFVDGNVLYKPLEVIMHFNKHSLQL